MTWFTSALIAGIVSYVATNIDDIVILTLFFAQVNATFRPKHIVVGQYLGYGALVAACLPGFFGGLIVPRAWIGLLGLLPIAIGIHQLVNQSEEGQVQTVSNESNSPGAKLPVISTFVGLLSPQTYRVAAVTFANGGDNFGVYVPLFAGSTLASLGVILVVYFLLTGVWCYATYRLTRQPAVADVLARYASRIVPFVLIGLGIFILIECGTYQLLPPFRSSIPFKSAAHV